MWKYLLIGAAIAFLFFLTNPLEVNEVQAEIPPIDTELPENHELATFALG